MTYTLADLPMFGGLDDGRLGGLAALSRRRRYPAGQVLCTEGDPAEQLIVLLDGRVRAGRVSAEGKEVVLAVEEAPVAFDKTALLVDGPHRATRTAMTAVEVAYLPRSAVLELLAAEPSVAARLLRTLAATVREPRRAAHRRGGARRALPRGHLAGTALCHGPGAAPRGPGGPGGRDRRDQGERQPGPARVRAAGADRDPGRRGGRAGPARPRPPGGPPGPGPGNVIMNGGWRARAGKFTGRRLSDPVALFYRH
ncbi:Crp/Fnr family transcriptional regulator [Nonomuraea angiospora]|uniref:Crp/Fnr family transcriptional regulator n=1 Tax=Nonomuraea angiospora TaxID=46172 RepID=UPI003F4E9513